MLKFCKNPPDASIKEQECKNEDTLIIQNPYKPGALL